MKIVAMLFLGMVTALGGLPAGATTPPPTKVLDKTAILDSYARGDNAWYVENIPFFDCPDKDLRDIYYYRWWNLRHNIHWDARAKAWTIHEGGGYGIVPCALGHHIYEGRWLRDRAYVSDDLRFWFAGFDNPRRYSNWVADACYAWYMVEFDKALALSFLDRLKANYAAWEHEHFDAARGLFKWVPDRDGMEASVAGFEQGAGDGFRWNTVIFGGEGYRPSLNSYMAADAAAIARLAELAGDRATAEAFSRKSETLRRKILGELWNPEKQFFMQRRASDYQFVGGREEIGFFPWAFHLVDNTAAFAAAWKQLVDQQGFHAKYGPTTLERRNPYCLRPFQHGCLWNGPSWPYSTSVTLAALSNLLNDYTQSAVTRDDYVALLKNYAATQHDPDGKPMVREDHHPDENRWLAQGPNYNHSRYCDLVITGLVGLRPRADNRLTVNPLVPAEWDYFCLEDVKYHGRSVTILYDRTGRKYGRGTGLRLFVDGREAAAAATVSKLTAALDGGSRIVPAEPEKYADKRPGAPYRLAARDQGVVLKHGDGPGRCDVYGAREAVLYCQLDGTYYLHYDGAGPQGWLACLALSKDLLHWTKKGPVLDFGKPGADDSATATSPWVYHDGPRWHMFYVGSQHATPPPDRIPSPPYLTLKAKAQSPAGPWTKQPDVVPFRTQPGTYYSDTASPGETLRQGDEYLMFFSAAMAEPSGLKRTIGIARTKNLDGPWSVDPRPMVPSEEQIENTSIYYQAADKTWFLFTNHIDIKDRYEYAGNVWVYWTRDLNRWDARHKAVVLDGKNCSWSSRCIGMPSVMKVGQRLALLYDAPGGSSISHMQRDIGLAWLDLPLVLPAE